MNNCELTKTLEWFKQAVPEPKIENQCVQIGCHLEEVAEMLEALGWIIEAEELADVANSFKSKNGHALWSVQHCNRLALLDSTRDQCVTGVGVDYMFGFDTIGAQREVNRSNFSKFVDGKPVFDENGKIKKAAGYSAPELEGYL